MAREKMEGQAGMLVLGASRGLDKGSGHIGVVFLNGPMVAVRPTPETKP